MTVRSKKLYLGLATTANYLQFYTVPSGHRTIVRTVRFYNGRGGANTLYFGVRSGGGYYPFFQGSIASHGLVIFDDWQVLHAGDQLDVYTDNTDINVWASGAELEL